MSAISIDMFMFDKLKLATIAQNELSTDFEEATVEWVDCPDLTQHPFYLTAPGLCGDTAILDIGGISNLFPCPKKEKIFKFENILQELNRTQYDNFIIGGGLFTTQPTLHLYELIMNASFSPGTGGRMTVRNESRVAFLEATDITNTEQIKLEFLTNTDPYCNIYGNFFVSKGLREQVLKVRAKKRFGRNFIDALQRAIGRFPYKTDSQLMGFGGTFVVKNGEALHHIIRNDWTGQIKTKEKIRNCIEYCNVQTPVTGFATFVNADRHCVVNMSPANPGLKIKSEKVSLTRSRAHGYSNYGGGYYHGNESNDDTEYLGYFSPATKLYRIDPVPMFCEMQSPHGRHSTRPNLPNVINPQ
ncbi:ester hydrolase C11orf54 homolog [Temnothorax americanus]|uniref:ester hydrolase C11orf54 homolog n=1 Tax=Temnothorax americanus TaxID=1964332 RepID=UPI0040679F31